MTRGRDAARRRTGVADFSDTVRDAIWTAAHTTPAVDVRIFADAPEAESPALSGIDALLTTPEILAEFFRRRALNLCLPGLDRRCSPEMDGSILSLAPAELADIIWLQLFVDHSPVSEAARIVLTTLGMFGLDVSSGDLRLLREQYAAIPATERLEKVLSLANLELILYPVESLSVADHLAGPARHPAFRPVLCLTDLLGNWKESAKALRMQGFGLKAKVDEFTPLELRRHLLGEIERLQPVAISFDWPGKEHVPGDTGVGRLLRESVLPLCRDCNLPFFLATGDARIDDLAVLWRDFPEVRFLVFPGRESEFAAAVFSASRSRNMLLCGPDQPLSYPRIMEGYTGMRLENLGSGFHACHSGADAAEEMVGCWAHARWMLGHALLRHYGDLYRTGWRFRDDDIRQVAAGLLGGNVRSFLRL